MGPIGPGRGREQCVSSPLPSTTCWSEKGGEESMVLLLCLWDCAGLIQEEGERGVVLLQTGWDKLTGWQFLPSSPDGRVQEKMQTAICHVVFAHGECFVSCSEEYKHVLRVVLERSVSSCSEECLVTRRGLASC